jgi:hypothetical protein
MKRNLRDKISVFVKQINDCPWRNLFSATIRNNFIVVCPWKPVTYTLGGFILAKAYFWAVIIHTPYLPVHTIR